MAHAPANPTASPKSNSPTDPFIGFINGAWLPQHELKLSVNDDGFRFAATAVERLRTYHGKAFQLTAHLARWRGTLATIGIDKTPDDAVVGALIEELLHRNRIHLSRLGDVGITIVATPGERETGCPTFLLHLNTIDHEKVLARQTTGQPLVVTDVVQPSPASWPRDAKVRCRLHYYLADQIAHRTHAEASGVLLDEDGSITETSIANIAIVTNGKIVSPPRDRVLGGITQQVVERIADNLAITWTRRPISAAELQSAGEILLMGTDSGIWFCNQINKKTLHRGTVFSQLVTAFDGFVVDECVGVR